MILTAAASRSIYALRDGSLSPAVMRSPAPPRPLLPGWQLALVVLLARHVRLTPDAHHTVRLWL